MFGVYRGKNPERPYDDSDHEACANHLMEAEAIKGDKSLMRHVDKKLKEKAGAITSIAQLRSMAQDDGSDPSTKSPARRNIEAADKD
jgi:hypothetical protein